MRILRDESGQVLVFPIPFGIRRKGSQEETGSAGLVKPKEEAGISQAIRAAQHCSFVCRFCDGPLLLPHDEMGLAFGHPSARKVQARSIATVCPACNHVGDYSLFRGCHGFDTRYKLVSSAIVGRTVLVDWLQCEEDTCPHRVPLYVTLAADLAEAEAKEMVASWQWNELACSLGHRIRAVALTIPK